MFKLNRKNFAATRVMGEGRFEYAYVDSKGMIVTDTTSIIRVTLPAQDALTEPCIFTKKQLDEYRPKSAADIVTMPDGLPAKTTGQYSVPNLEAAIVDSSKQTAVIAVNAKQLIELLKAAVDVTDHSRSLVRLRVCGGQLRIDAHRDQGGQEFTGVLVGISYNGNCIPGDPAGTVQAYEPSEAFDEKTLTLPNTEGRKFR